MLSWWFNALAVIERLVIIAAAILAAFPLYQYWADAPGRERERLVREAEVVAICEEKKPGWFTDLYNLDEGRPRQLGENFLTSSPRLRLAFACFKLGLLHEKDENRLRRHGLVGDGW